MLPLPGFQGPQRAQGTVYTCLTWVLGPLLLHIRCCSHYTVKRSMGRAPILTTASVQLMNEDQTLFWVLHTLLRVVYGLLHIISTYFLKTIPRITSRRPHVGWAGMAWINWEAQNFSKMEDEGLFEGNYLYYYSFSMSEESMQPLFGQHQPRELSCLISNNLRKVKASNEKRVSCNPCTTHWAIGPVLHLELKTWL